MVKIPLGLLDYQVGFSGPLTYKIPTGLSVELSHENEIFCKKCNASLDTGTETIDLLIIDVLYHFNN